MGGEKRLAGSNAKLPPLECGSNDPVGTRAHKWQRLYQIHQLTGEEVQPWLGLW